jgi:hypothetical protein
MHCYSSSLYNETAAITFFIALAGLASSGFSARRFRGALRFGWNIARRLHADSADS